MKLPSFTRLFKQDFQEEYQDMIGTLAETINGSMEALYEAFNRKITLKDNVACTVKDVEVIVDANGRPTATTGMSLDVAGQVMGLQVIRVDNLTNTLNPPKSQPYITYTTSENSVLFSNITGLEAGKKYRLKVIAYQG